MHNLTPRETEIAELCAAGKNPAQICNALGIAQGTVKIHLTNIYLKLRISGRGAMRELRMRSGELLHGEAAPKSWNLRHPV